MVFKYNKLSFESDVSIPCQLASQHMKQVESEIQFVPLAGRHFPEKKHISDGRSPDEKKNDDCKAVKLENNKRLLDEEEENLEASTKRIKQLDEDFFIVSEPSFSNFLTDNTNIKDTSAFKRSSDSHDESLSFPRFSCNVFEDYAASYDSPARTSSFPGYYGDSPVVHNNRVEEEQPSIFHYCPRKPVAIGCNHQAELPSLTPKTSRACNNEITEISTEELTASYCSPSCHCMDAGSISCVRQHIKEARENLKSALGHERFLELGLSEMGESVALNWTDKEERLFHKVVISNPVSMGRNFWNELCRAFPSKSSKEIVSYYFNVYMLRKRAEQNRFDSFNADSDNDEWQLEDEEGEDDDAENDDSAVESPEDGFVGMYSGAYIWDDGDDKNEEGGESEFGATKVNQDVLDDSCTSYEELPKAHQDDDLYHGLSCMDGHDFLSDHCGHIPWEMMSYASSMDKEPDLLPTSNVIEQFGKGTWG